MRFKLVPAAPETLARVGDAQTAVPLVPDTEADCCARLMDRCGFPSRDVARTWLTLLRALELVEETADGTYRRRRHDPEPDALRESFRENVFAAEEVLATLRAADEPLSAEAVFEHLWDEVPDWERMKQAHEWEDRWRDRVGDICDWLVLFGFAERTAEGYRAGDVD